MDLTTATPAQIDEQLFPLWAEVSRWSGYLADAHKWAKRDADRGIERPESAKHIAKYEAKIADLRVQCAPLEAEYHRRGGWTRAYLALSHNGHIHRNTSCSTCRLTTLFGYFPKVSGLAESEIVELAGERACTVCYPSAPVEVLSRPTRLFTADEEAAQAAREEKARKAAEKAAKKAAGALLTPVKDGRWNTITTVRQAWIELVDLYAYYTPAGQFHDDLIAALAEKLEQTPEQVVTEAKAKAKRRK